MRHEHTGYNTAKPTILEARLRLIKKNPTINRSVKEIELPSEYKSFSGYIEDRS